MTTPREKLQTLLFQLFQFDSADLNFGLYAVMNRKRAEIDHFIRHKLLEQVVDGLQQVANQSHSEAKINFDAARNELIAALGPAALHGDELAPEFANLRAIPVVQNYLKAKAERAQSVVSLELEMDIYNALYEFFSRYYKDGDFMAERRYGSRDSYAIPYNGDEVYLHWANRDQYYVKSSEYFTNYRFTLKGALGLARELTVAFVLTAAETARDNNKAPNRYFIQTPAQPLTWDGARQTLHIPFQYRPLTDEEKAQLGTRGNHIQPRLNEQSYDQILAALHAGPAPTGLDEATRRLLSDRLQAPHRPDAGEQDELAYQLNRYTAVNSRDFFVHKDLGGFLTSEFDYYLKAEVADLDNLQALDPVRLQQEGAKIATTRAIGRRIIAFLDQLESFQKLLFLKPKFVLQSDYCLTLDKIPAADRARFYPQIAANPRQRAEWETLYGVKLAADADLDPHPHLMVDTAFFDTDFKLALLACFADLDEACDGLLIHGENFQALGLIAKCYEKEVDCIFIDPPYNKGGDEFVYKDSYQHSSWLSMMANRMELSTYFLNSNGSLWITIDEVESANLRLLGTQGVPSLNFISELTWEKVYSPRMDAKQFSASYDYIQLYSTNPSWKPNALTIDPDLEQFPHTDKAGRHYRSDPLRKWGKNSLREDRPNLWFPIESPTGEAVYPVKPDGREGCWRWGKATVQARYDELDWLDKGNGLQPYVRQYADESTSRPPETLWPYELAGSTHEAQEQIKELFTASAFSTPKPSKLIEHVLKISGDKGAVLLDYFAGSGSSGQAVIELNRLDDGNRKYILVEMADYFETVLKPRLQKLVFAQEWQNGKPINDGLFSTGLSHMFQYLRLESYDDTFHNIAFQDEGAQPPLWALDDYLLTYMLPHETQESPTLLNLAQLRTPFAYQLNVATSGGVLQPTPIDLITTFNFLIGLRVRTISAFTPPPATGADNLVRVTGVNRQGERLCILWRNVPSTPAALDAERDWLRQTVLADVTYDLLYINGDTTLPDATILDAEFKRLLLPREGV